ncbi:hypothetical protein D3C81_2098820 [compost metagenome]
MARLRRQGDPVSFTEPQPDAVLDIFESEAVILFPVMARPNQPLLLGSHAFTVIADHEAEIALPVHFVNIAGNLA